MNFNQSFSNIVDLFQEGLGSILGANKNWGRWSDKVAVMFPDIASRESILKNRDQ